MKKQLSPDQQTWANMRDALRTARARVASLERQNKRLLAEDYQIVAEAEIRRLEQMVQDLTRLCLLAEAECSELRRIVEGKVA